MKRYVIIKKCVPTEKTLARCPEAKTKYYIFGEDEFIINYKLGFNSYDFNDTELKDGIRACAWEAPKGCKISLRAYQRRAKKLTEEGNYISTCEMVEVEV